MKIVAIVGSPRLQGNTNYLVDCALEEANKQGIDTEKIVLGEHDVRPCQGHDNCASLDACLQKDDAPEILEKFRNADGVILATPVYYYNVSAQMKAFIDRNYFIYKHEQEYKARAAGLIVVAEQEGIEDTLHTLKQFADEFRNVGDRLFVASGYASRPWDARGNSSLVEEAADLGRKMAESLKE